MANHEDANKRLGEIKTTLNRLNKNNNKKDKKGNYITKL